MAMPGSISTAVYLHSVVILTQRICKEVGFDKATITSERKHGAIDCLHCLHCTLILLLIFLSLTLTHTVYTVYTVQTDLEQKGYYAYTHNIAIKLALWASTQKVG